MTRVIQVGEGGATLGLGVDGSVSVEGDVIISEAEGFTSDVTQEELNTSVIIDRSVTLGEDITSLGIVKCITGNMNVTAKLPDFGQLEYVGGYMNLHEVPTLKGLERIKYSGDILLDSQFKYTREDVLVEWEKFKNIKEIDALGYLGQNFPKIFKDLVESKIC